MIKDLTPPIEQHLNIEERKPLKTISKLDLPNIFLAGIIVYTLGYCLSFTTVSIVSAAAPLIQMLGLVLMIATAGYVLTFRFDSAYLRIVYLLYCSWLLYLIVSGYSYFSDYSFLRGFFLDPRSGMLYFAPLLLLFPREFDGYKKVFNAIAILGAFFIVFDVIFIRDLLNSDINSPVAQTVIETFSNLGFSCGFLLLTYFYHTKKKQLLALTVILAAILFTMIRARRGLLFMYLSMSLFSYLIFLYYSRTRILVIYLSILAVLVGALWLSSTYRLDNSRLLGSLIERGDVNTRETVEWYFHDDMETKDWIFGRGIKGEYFAPDIEEDLPTNYRSNIETGYEQTILKGGLISLGLFLLIAVPGMLKGLFFSKNMLSKAAGLWIFMSLVNSYPSTVNAFTPQYLLVWICIGICYSKKIRKTPEKQMIEIFREKEITTTTIKNVKSKIHNLPGL